MAQRDLCLLSLDGGGVRGLSTLYILQSLMERVDPKSPPKPCDYFDMIGGTSTGGGKNCADGGRLIAIMLGRLQMDVPSCIKAYTKLSTLVFHKRGLPISLRQLALLKLEFRGRFNAAALESAVKEIVMQHGLDGDALMKEEQDPKCKVFVCAARKENKDITHLKTYRSDRDSNDKDISIWQAGRATSAATSFFDPIKIGPHGEMYVDGATGANNPVRELWAEAQDLWRRGSPLAERIQCLISIGTGQPSLQPFGGTLSQVGKSLVAIATDTQHTAERFSREHQDLLSENRYFRFNVEKGLEGVGLEEVQKQSELVSATRRYLETQAVIDQMRTCKQALLGEETQQRNDLSKERNMAPDALQLSGKEYLECLSALSITDPSDDMNAILSTKGVLVEGTCSWIQQSPSYMKWMEDDLSKVLWIMGDPGKGKTMLAISMVNRLSSHEQTVFKFFCDNKDDRRNKAGAIVRGLLYQVLKQHRDLSGCFGKEYRIHGDRLFSALNTVEILWRILHESLDQSASNRAQPTIYIIVDALDECEPESRSCLLRLIEPLTENARHKGLPKRRVKWLLTSRNEVPIKEILFNSLTLDLEERESSKQIAEDVSSFIEFKVQWLLERKGYDNVLGALIKDTLRQKAEGTFLWVSLACAELADVPSFLAEKVLRKLPPGLNPLYERILSQILNNRHKEVVTINVAILRAALAAFRPMKLRELAVAADLPRKHRNKVAELAEHARGCRSLLTIRDEIVYFVHQSAKDYLVSVNSALELSPRLATENMAIATRCFGYICGGTFKNGPIDLNEQSKQRWPFLEYAAMFFLDHGRLAPPEFKQSFSPNHAFFARPSPLREAWWRSYWVSAHRREDVPEGFTLLHLAAYSGILSLAMAAFEWGQGDLGAKDSYGRTPLHWAGHNGHVEMTQLLLERGADIEASQFPLGTTLHLAARNGHVGVVDCLLRNGANIDARDAGPQSAMFRAVGLGRFEVVQLMLEHELDIDERDHKGWNALFWAMFGEFDNIAELLIEKGIDVDAQDDEGSTALMEAITFENETVMGLLLDKGAAVEAKHHGGRTALSMAVQKKNENMVRLLLENGAAIEEPDEYGHTALFWATSARHEGIFRMILERGPDIEKVDSDTGWTMLHWAVFTGSETMVQLLLEKGAKIGSKDMRGRTAVDNADICCFYHIVRLLEETAAKRRMESGNCD